MRLDRQGCGDGDNVSRESMGELVEEIDEQELEEDDENKTTVSAKTVARRTETSSCKVHAPSRTFENVGERL